MDSRTTGFGASISAFFSAVLRFFIALAGAIFMLSLLFVGLVLGLTLMLFALLRGRRPAGLIWRAKSWPPRPGGAHGASNMGRGEVVDIEAREIVAEERRDG